jgi:glycine hydroxymethyltransferase
VFPFGQGGPLMHAVAAKAVALKEASTSDYQTYARQVVANAAALAKALEAEGMRAVSGGTDTHLALLDVRPLEVTGAEAEHRCDVANITLNKNAIPFDPRPPLTASGIRIGSPCVTTQGMTEPDMAEIARLIGRALRAEPGAAAGDAELAEVGAAVRRLVSARPAYPRS